MLSADTSALRHRYREHPVHVARRPSARDGAQRWSAQQVLALYELPLAELLDRARQAHLAHFVPNAVQLSSLLSIKTGGCPEDCGYCPQSAQFDTGVEREALLPLEAVLAAARSAKAAGASRFCMGAAWRSPKPHQVQAVAEMVSEVKALGLETCVTLGMLREGQAEVLRDAGLDYYNHNLDTSPEYYGKVISTRTYADRLETLARVRQAGVKVCCGGIVGMGETREDRAGLIAELASLDPAPESVPINHLIAVPGTPMADAPPLDPIEFVKTIAVARVAMPASVIRLSAGREAMDDATQALCFHAGANSVFYGETLLTRGNPQLEADRRLFARLGLHASERDPHLQADQPNPRAEAAPCSI
ncbi:biotin synthase BioB [Verticiella sediminum]|uniref:Biotin synthase n=1 Tax=Verticiella sediminum TaxID=1247510 RepID=A0A556AQ61_9BURK|nr:biotin synthase BioB [Verticiella sediminum]TSH95026.1 biotin synthase BioB [Verticiella sediminum]